METAREVRASTVLRRERERETNERGRGGSDGRRRRAREEMGTRDLEKGGGGGSDSRGKERVMEEEPKQPKLPFAPLRRADRIKKNSLEDRRGHPLRSRDPSHQYASPDRSSPYVVSAQSYHRPFFSSPSS